MRKDVEEMTLFEIKGDTTENMAGRLEALKAVKVDERAHACGCCGRSDGSYRCSSR